jgi:hypothetical protein
LIFYRKFFDEKQVPIEAQTSEIVTPEEPSRE